VHILLKKSVRFKLSCKASFLIMATLGSPCSLIFVFLMLSVFSKTISKPNSSTNVSQVFPPKDKCHNMYKKVEAQLYEIKQELGEMREDIKSLMEKKMTSKYHEKGF